MVNTLRMIKSRILSIGRRFGKKTQKTNSYIDLEILKHNVSLLCFCLGFSSDLQSLQF